jgi:hypothetical protein
MKTHSKSKALIALVLAISIAVTGCSAQWINIALQDLPVLTQMALNIATLVSALATGKQASTGDVAVIQNISAQASRDLNLLQTLYGEYKSNPNSTTLQKIENVISELNRNLPALLESGHISNPTLTARVTAAVNLILATVNSFASLMPTPASTLAARTQTTEQRSPTAQTQTTAGITTLPRVKDLKAKWNEQVCASSGNPSFDQAFADCEIR